MIYKTLDIDVAASLNGTTVLNTIALNQGAQLLRVHDVKEAKENHQTYGTTPTQQTQLIRNFRACLIFLDFQFTGCP